VYGECCDHVDDEFSDLNSPGVDSAEFWYQTKFEQDDAPPDGETDAEWEARRDQYVERMMAE
jgi:hypothetical protein